MSFPRDAVNRPYLCRYYDLYGSSSHWANLTNYFSPRLTGWSTVSQMLSWFSKLKKLSKVSSKEDFLCNGGFQIFWSEKIAFTFRRRSWSWSRSRLRCGWNEFKEIWGISVESRIMAILRCLYFKVWQDCITTISHHALLTQHSSIISFQVDL